MRFILFIVDGDISPANSLKLVAGVYSDYIEPGVPLQNISVYIYLITTTIVLCSFAVREDYPGNKTLLSSRFNGDCCGTFLLKKRPVTMIGNPENGAGCGERGKKECKNGILNQTKEPEFYQSAHCCNQKHQTEQRGNRHDYY